jgi:hypothetical protein
MDRRRRVGRVGLGAGLVEDDVVAARDPRVLRVDGAVGGVDGRHDRQAALDELVLRGGVDADARVRRRQQRVEVPAEGHVVGQPADPGDLDLLVAGVQERGDVAQRDAARPAVLHRDADLDESRRRVEADRGLGLGDGDEPLLDEHRGHADRPVAAHRQAARDLDEQHAPVGVGPQRGLQDRPAHRGVPARLLHEQEPQVVHVRLEVELALEHRRARDGVHPGRDHARRHPLRVGVDRPEGERGAHAATGSRRAATAVSRTLRSAAPSGPRGGRVGPPARPTASIAPLKYWTSFGVMSSRARGRIRR